LDAAAETLANYKKGGLLYLAHKDFRLDEKHLYLKLDGLFISLSERGQVVDEDIVSKGLKQLSYGSDGFASEFYPICDGVEQKSFVISPERNFGRLCIASSGVGADIIAVRFDRGEKVAEIAGDYGVTTDEVEEAIRWRNRLAPCNDRLAA